MFLYRYQVQVGLDFLSLKRWFVQQTFTPSSWKCWKVTAMMLSKLTRDEIPGVVRVKGKQSANG